MSEPLRILFSFFLGEFLLILMVGWIYFQLRKMGILRPGTSTNRTVMLLFVLLPLLIAVFALPGLIYRMNIALSLLPMTGGSSITTTPVAGTPTPPLFGNTPGSTSYPTQPALLSTNTIIPEPMLMLTPSQPAAPPTPTAPLDEQ